nr:MAG TPA: hypothetical protein [Caudoviricetes sp.]
MENKKDCPGLAHRSSRVERIHLTTRGVVYPFMVAHPERIVKCK